MSSLWQAVRGGCRRLGGDPAFSAIAVVVLGLGIGANTAVYSVVNALLVRPLPGAASGGELVGLYSRDTRQADRYRPFSYPNYADIRSAATTLSAVSASEIAMVGLTEGDLVRRAFVAMVSSNFFETMGVAPAVGRAFLDDEEPPGRAAAVCVVSDLYWRKVGRDPGLVGRTLLINHQPFTVVGVAPQGFTGPSAVITPEIWLPLSASAVLKNDYMRGSPGVAPGSRDAHELTLIARLRDGASREAADRELAGVAARLAAAYPAENRDQTIIVATLPRTGIGPVPSSDDRLWTVSVVLMAMSGIVLVIACLNLANLLLARGTDRQPEMAIRLALGASRGAIVRQLLVEGFLLALGGAALGTLLAQWATSGLLQTLSPMAPMPLEFDPAPDWRVLAVTLAWATVATLAFALGPAWRVSRPAIVDALRRQHWTPLRRPARVFGARNLMLSAQLGLSLALLVVGALFVRSAVAAGHATPGFDLDRGLLIEVDPSLAAFGPAQAADAHRGLVARLRAVAGVEAASFASHVPLGEINDAGPVERATGDGQPGAPGPAAARAVAIQVAIGANYFRAIGLPVLRGREFSADEAEGTVDRRVVIIDEFLAQRLFPAPGDNPVGQFIRVSGDGGPAGPPLQIVGLVPGVRSDLLRFRTTPHVYLPYPARPRAWMTYHVRPAAGGPASPALLRTLRGAIRTYDERLPVLGMTTLEEFAARSTSVWMLRSAARVFSAFALAGLFAAVVGIYGVNAYAVARRTREIGIRIAVGASGQDIARLVLRDAFVVVAAGTAAGLLLAIALGTLVRSWLFGVAMLDPAAWLVSALVLGTAATVASYLPARRAVRMDPIAALRHE